MKQDWATNLHKLAGLQLNIPYIGLWVIQNMFIIFLH